MSNGDLWYEVEKIKRWIRRRRILSAIKYMLYLFLVIGIIGYFISAYENAHSLRVEMYRFPAFERVGFMAYRITAYPNIVNPTETVFEAKNMYVKVFIYDYYVGEIFKPYLRINPGNNFEEFSFELNLRDLPQIVKDIIAENGMIRVRFSGIVTIPLKAFGILPWHEITIPLDILPEQHFQVSSEDASLLSYLKEFEIIGINSIEEIKLNIELLRSRLDELSGIINELKERASILEKTKLVERVDVTFTVVDLKSRPLIGAKVHITPGEYLEVYQIGEIITVRGMIKGQKYEICVEWTNYRYGTTAAECRSFTPEELNGLSLMLPVGDVEIQIVDRFNYPVVGAIVTIDAVSTITDLDGRALFGQIPLEWHGIGISYNIRVSYVGQIFDDVITLDRTVSFRQLVLNYP